MISLIWEESYLCVLPIAVKNQPVVSPANPVLLVFTVVQTSINFPGFIAFILLEEKNEVCGALTGQAHPILG